MRITCAILLALGIAAAPFDLSAQQSPTGSAAQVFQPPVPVPAVPITGAQTTHAVRATDHRSPSDGYGRPGGVSYRYDALGRITEIVRTPAQ